MSSAVIASVDCSTSTTWLREPVYAPYTAAHADWRPDKMGKATIYELARFLVGLNGFEPGQSHALHAHVRMDKMYYVIAGRAFIDLG